MKDISLKLLLIEDDQADVSAILQMLKEAQNAKFSVEVKNTLIKGLEYLAKNPVDIVLLDLTLPDSLGLDTFARIHAHAPGVPIIVVTASSDETQALMAFQKGAQDYLIKGIMDSDLLERSIRYSIERNRAQIELRESECRLSKVAERIKKINDCFLSFEEDPVENICRLTTLFGELLGATCSLYNCVDREGMLCSLGQWQVPEDYKTKDKPEGHICYDVIQEGDGEAFLVRDLQNTKYAETDPNVKRYNLKTYLGYPIKWKNEIIGSLCAVYQTDFVPSEEDLELVNVIATAVEVEEKRRRSEEELRVSEDTLRLTQFSVDHTSTPIFWVGKDARFLYVNNASCRALKYSKEELLSMKVYDIDPDFPEERWIKHWEELKKKKSFTFETIHKAKDGNIFPVEVNVNYFEYNGKEYNFAFASDITDRKNAESELQRINKELTASNKKLSQLALKDLHTGLYNHHYLADIIDSEFYRSKRYGTPISVIMLDVDYFKSINEIYGHQFGDIVLKQLAQLLKKMTRQYDIVIRYSGEEFIIISPGSDREQAIAMAQRILDAISIYNFGNDKNVAKLKMSLAAVSYPEDKVTNALDLVKAAEQILAKAKDEGGNSVYSSMDKKKSIKALEQLSKSKSIDVLKGRLERLNKQAKQSMVESILAFAKTIELKDHYTGEHVEKTVKYATEIAQALGLSKNEIEMVRQAAMLHDLGKIGVSEKILKKKAKLTKKELEEIRKHPKIAADILRPIHVLNAIIPFILYHHEWWDGHGYPGSLKGEDIPLGARIVAIADVYQALISKRPYRKAFSKADALKIIKEGSGSQFDPHIVDIFLNILKKENHK